MNPDELLHHAIQNLTEEVRRGRTEQRADLAIIWTELKTAQAETQRQAIALARIEEQITPPDAKTKLAKYAPAAAAGAGGAGLVTALIEFVPLLAKLFGG